MKILHRIAFKAEPAQVDQMKSLGFNVEVVPNASFPGEHPLISCDAAEDHPNWPVLIVFLKQWDYGIHHVWTEFTAQELESARYLLMSAWNNGFPQPQDFETYKHATYDLTHGCDQCGSGRVQKAPFRIKIEPKWNRRGIMTLFWVGDEFFVPPAIWETVFKPFGIGCRPVTNRKGAALKTVVQLVVTECVDLVVEGLKPVPCQACGRNRYEWSGRGPYPPLVQEPKGAMARTNQEMGHGWAQHPVIIAQELRRALEAHNVRGAEFIPVDAALPALVA